MINGLSATAYGAHRDEGWNHSTPVTEPAYKLTHAQVAHP